MYGCVYVTRYDVYLFRVPGVASHTKIYIYKIKTIYFISTALYCFYVPFLIFGNGVRQNIITIYYGIFHIHMLFPYYIIIASQQQRGGEKRRERVCLLLLNFEFDRTTERIREFV